MKSNGCDERNIIRNQRGQVAVEYAIIAAALAVAAVAITSLFRPPAIAGWVDVVKETVFVPAEDLSDIKAIINETADR